LREPPPGAADRSGESPKIRGPHGLEGFRESLEAYGS
jgi:hypothetical protein